LQEELADRHGFFPFDAQRQGDVRRRAQQPNIDPVQFVIEAKIGNCRDVDDPAADADELWLHGRTYPFYLLS